MINYVLLLREMTIIAHQKQIEQLRESFRQKVLEAENYPKQVCILLMIGNTITFIIRPHRSTTYIDAAYCYRLSSVVCQLVCQSVTVVSPAKTAKWSRCHLD